MNVGNDLHSVQHIRDALRLLHKALLDAERISYEKSFGRIGSDFYLLQLAADDPQFAWLRALMSEMTELDVALSGPEAVSAADLRLLATRLRFLLLASDSLTPFQQRYQAALQEHPAVIMAHSAVIRLLPPASQVSVFRGSSTTENAKQGGRDSILHRPGLVLPGYGDAGYGPLAAVVESRFEQELETPKHEHRNEEIVSWGTMGAIRFRDLPGGDVVVDSDHLLVMNTGRGYAFSESVMPTDAPAGMVQVFIRPRAIMLEPAVQFGPLPDAVANTWRPLAGPDSGDAPFTVRNTIEMFDICLDKDASVELPMQQGWDVFLLVLHGEVKIDGVPLEHRQHALVQAPEPVALQAVVNSVVLGFLIDPRATVTRAGTFGR